MKRLHQGETHFCWVEFWSWVWIPCNPLSVQYSEVSQQQRWCWRLNCVWNRCWCLCPFVHQGVLLLRLVCLSSFITSFVPLVTILMSTFIQLGFHSSYKYHVRKKVRLFPENHYCWRFKWFSVPFLEVQNFNCLWTKWEVTFAKDHTCVYLLLYHLWRHSEPAHAVALVWPLATRC